VLDSDPRFEFPDRFALHRQLDVGINGVHVFAARMAHQRLADLLHDACFHEPRVERVSEFMEAEMPRERPFDESVPGRLVITHGVAAIGEDDTFLLADR
jgi:hypothetical protein